VARRSQAPDDASVVAQQDWVRHLAQLGVHNFVVDNEPDLWPVTHTDVHPVEPSYDDMVDLFEEYATAIKDADPQAQVMGPAASGWLALMYSARDRGDDNFRTHADRRAHADMPFLPWWLEQIRQRDEQSGRRTLDVLDVHFYPQAGEVFSNASGAETNALRLRSTRALWDPDYVDESWIGEPVRLIPRLRDWIDRSYPGTRLAINEWNWGADQTMNGALAIADVLGIFGREGVDMAAYWTVPPPGSPGEYAFKLYTSQFGDQSLAASSSAPNDVTVYASRDSGTGELVLVALNKREADIPTTLTLEGAVAPSARVFRYSGQNPSAIESLGSVALSELTLPAESITVLRLTGSAP
jgi:hypothetical protein